MTRLLRSFALLALFATTACSTVVEGRNQSITVKSEPQGATCLFKQADDVVGHVITPGTATIPKSKNDLVIFCSRDGYESATIKNRSDLAITSLGNMAFGQFSFIGNAVDSASGASNKYDSEVLVKLIPAETPAAFPAPPGAPAIKELPMESVARLAIQPPTPMAYTTALPVAAPVTQTVYTASNPSLNAALVFGNAARKAAPVLPAPLTYAQATAESLHRPPFDAIQ